MIRHGTLTVGTFHCQVSTLDTAPKCWSKDDCLLVKRKLEYVYIYVYNCMWLIVIYATFTVCWFIIFDEFDLESIQCGIVGLYAVPLQVWISARRGTLYWWWCPWRDCHQQGSVSLSDSGHGAAARDACLNVHGELILLNMYRYYIIHINMYIGTNRYIYIYSHIHIYI